MKNRVAISMTLLVLTVILGGCGGGTVEAVAPARQAHLNGVAPESGNYTLYRATGLEESNDPTLVKVLNVSLMKGQRLGFRWVVDKTHEWDTEGGFHLVAYAGNQTRDLGPFLERDVKYVWAGEGDDVMGYFHSRGFRLDLGLDEIGPQ